MGSEQGSGRGRWETASLWGESATWEGEERPWVGGRYRLAERLGSGGGGEVYAAVDTVLGEEVALKRLFRPADERVQREIRALRQLDLPGVVRLRDTVHEDGALWLVMDRVRGHPFPGVDPADSPGQRWAALRPALVRLLEILDAVHAHGVVHRDLKPANLLVDEQGRPWVLDFGLARGRELGSTITVRGQVLGTPRYISPEVLSGGEVDGRADLYSVGVMLYEHLAQRPPHAAEHVDGLVAARLGQPAPSLAAACPALPRAVTDLVDALLQRDPDRRPASAGEVLGRLTGRAADRLPWLGPRAPIERLVSAALAGRRAAVAGPPGSGRTRVLAEVADALQAAGCPVARTTVGDRPFESLAAALPLPTQGDVPTLVRERLAALLVDHVLLVDDAERVDRWSRRLLEELPGAVLWARGPGASAEVALEPLPEEALRAVFVGPDRFLHLREDGARVLRARSGGHPARVATELRAWVHGGLARWEDGRIALDREALDHLAAGGPGALPELPLEPGLAEVLRWVLMAGEQASVELLVRATGRPGWQIELEVEALVAAGAVARDGERLHALARPDHAASAAAAAAQHRALAAALPPGLPRARHLLAAGEIAALAAELEPVLREQWRRGRLGEARALLQAGFEAGIPQVDPPRARALAGLGLRLAIAEVTPGARQQAARLARTLEQPALDALLAAWQAFEEGRLAEGMAALRAMGPLPHREEEIVRASLLYRAGARIGGEVEAALHAELDGWPLAEADPEAAALVQGWRGMAAYRRGDFEQALDLLERSLAGKDTVTGRLSTMLNLANVAIEAGQHARCAALCAEAGALAARHRQPLYEARAAITARNSARRAGEVLDVDVSFVDAVRVLGVDDLLVVAALTEVQIARQHDAVEVAVAMGQVMLDAAERSGNRVIAVEARSLLVELSGDAAPASGRGAGAQ